VLRHADVAWQRWDLYVSADPWTRPTLRRCSRSANFFHGVAGNSNLDDPSALQPGFDAFDRVGFINTERRDTYLARGLVSADAAALVGFPKSIAWQSTGMTPLPSGAVLDSIRIG